MTRGSGAELARGLQMGPAPPRVKIPRARRQPAECVPVAPVFRRAHPCAPQRQRAGNGCGKLSAILHRKRNAATRPRPAEPGRLSCSRCLHRPVGHRTPGLAELFAKSPPGKRGCGSGERRAGAPHAGARRAARPFPRGPPKPHVEGAAARGLPNSREERRRAPPVAAESTSRKGAPLLPRSSSALTRRSPAESASRKGAPLLGRVVLASVRASRRGAARVSGGGAGGGAGARRWSGSGGSRRSGRRTFAA